MPEERRDTGSREAFYDMMKDVHKKTNDIHTTLFGPEGQPKMGFVYRTDEKLSEHEERLDDVEKRQWKAAGAAGVLAVVAGYLAKKLGFS